MRCLRGCALAASMGFVAMLMALTPSPAGAALSVVPQEFPGGFSSEPSTTQAGAPADVVTSFTLTLDSPTPWPGADVNSIDFGGLVRDTVLDLPVGVNGNAQAVPQCPELLDAAGCPASSQVGVVDLRAVLIVSPDFQIPNRLNLALYNMTPSKGEVARLGASSAQITLQLSVTLRPHDHGVRVEARRFSSLFPVVSASFVVWGLPGDPSHDFQRCERLTPLPLSSDFTTVPFCNAASGEEPEQPQSFVGDVHPFFVNPTSCAGPRQTLLSISGWADPTHFESELAAAPAPTGCDQIAFEPTVAIKTDTAQPDTPTGLDVGVTFPLDAG